MTAQLNENLILDGEWTGMAFCPSLPENDTRIRKLDNNEFNALYEDLRAMAARAREESSPEAREAMNARREEFSVFSTACWRRYIGTWEIKNGKFYLVSIKGIYKMRTETPILADWFSGVIRIPRGKLLHYVHMGFGSVHEEEMHLKIVEGVVVDTKIIDNRDKEFDTDELGLRNLPGYENRFDGDDEL